MPLTQAEQNDLLEMIADAVFHLVRGARAESLNVAKGMAKILEKVRLDNEKLAKECEEALILFMEKGCSKKLRKVLNRLAPRPYKHT